ncbi:MAG: methylenetetrahydrofolate reductase [NAD(P)H] [Gammaproteobacteria bacterium]|nr:methylenetetrahydrofolate reductase [NAD(P)H] [Gammaproteobacteria bacterium]
MNSTSRAIGLSFEFFPPRTPEGVARLSATRRRLAALDPEFFSVTFGAGGSTRELTLETVLEVRNDTGIDTAPHLSCIGFSLADIRAVLERYASAGIRRLVALRGDMPSGTSGFGELRHANELVEFIRRERGEHFHIEVAAYPEVHPQAPGAAADLDNFLRKVAAGANGAITQYFYNADAYFRFVEQAAKRGVDVPIVPGIMPITNFSNLRRFSEMCGAEIPRWMVKALQDLGDDHKAIFEFGVDVVTRLCDTLLAGGAPGLHFYTMNQHEAASAVCANLMVRGRGGA